jgi:hypothetical protein
LAWPDRWASWWLSGVPTGLALIKKWRPDVLWSTYPTATAHLIALTLRKLTGVKWVADFRDSMTEAHYPPNPRKRAIFRWIEQRTVAGAARVVFTAPGTLRMYAQRYELRAPEFWRCIENGYDERSFPDAVSPAVHARAPGRRLSLLHAGILYPSERDPRPFFAAIARLKRSGAISATELQIKLRATGHDGVHRDSIAKEDIADLVQLLPLISYKDAISEMMTEDGLLLFQAPNCNHQIPAKVYEYLRTGKPILAMTDKSGDTAATLMRAGIDTIVDINDSSSIAIGVEEFLRRLRRNDAPTASPEIVQTLSRRSQCVALAELLDSLREGGEGAPIRPNNRTRNADPAK